jgi:2-polyprenyl-6-methoxyphenol hydroxylase-like FAD-dependent oxidoreductase
MSKLLIIGGGIAGMSLAVFMRRIGWDIDLIEADPEWRVYGAGISITGPTFRALDQLGLIEALRREGHCSTSGDVVICAPDGTPLHHSPTPPIAPGMPTTGGIMRPALHRLLSDLTRSSGADIRLGVTVKSFHEKEDGVSVATSDGETRSYDLVVGADGVNSLTRALLFPDAPKPVYTGQYCWRVALDRQPMIDRAHFFMAGEVTAGLVPVSETGMYMWLLEPVKVREHIEPATQHLRLAAIMQRFGGPLAIVRDGLTAQSPIIVRPLEAMLLPRPWNVGRILLIGDAVHATTPHLASGAGIATEDALVLSRILAETGSIPDAVAAFTERRWDRCKLVVENSVEIGRMQQGSGTPQQLNALMAQSMMALRANI